ncbi:MAG: HAD-IB family phosphatase [Planctomycetota bacterium]
MTRRAHDPPYGTVAFDCDSTLSQIEGIDELTSGNSEIAALTAAAMEGRVPIEGVYGQRLAILRPTRGAVEGIGAAYVEALVPGVREVVAALRALGKRVAVVSGGLLPPVLHLARDLGIDPTLVRAVDLFFDADGEYAGFDDTSPLARARGKIDVLRELCPDGDVAFAGDGATDLEALEACARFVAFGGVVKRPGIAEGADRAVDAPDFTALLPHLLAPDELDRLAAIDGFERVAARAREVRA